MIGVFCRFLLESLLLSSKCWRIIVTLFISQEILWLAKILLQQHCYSCHSRQEMAMRYGCKLRSLVLRNILTNSGTINFLAHLSTPLHQTITELIVAFLKRLFGEQILTPIQVKSYSSLAMRVGLLAESQCMVVALPLLHCHPLLNDYSPSLD